VENRCWRSGLAGPSDRVHRAVNVGNEVFEGVVTFFLITWKRSRSRKTTLK